MTLPALDIIRQGTIHIVRPHNPFKPENTVAPGIYDIEITEDDIRLHFRAAQYDVPNFIFGKKVRDSIETIYATFTRRAQSMGAILSGKMGSGKTVTAEALCNRVIKNGGVVIQVNSPISARVLELLRPAAGENCVFYFQEFTVNYSKYDNDPKKIEQGKMLEFFSSQSLAKSFFILTLNDTQGLNQFMLERPGRFLFHVKYQGIDTQTLNEILTHLKIEGLRADWLTMYVHQMGKKITVDQVIEIIRATAHCTTEAEFENTVTILNVARPMVKFVLTIDQAASWVKPWHWTEVTQAVNDGDYDIATGRLKFTWADKVIDVAVGEQFAVSGSAEGKCRIVLSSNSETALPTFSCEIARTKNVDAGEPF